MLVAVLDDGLLCREQFDGLLEVLFLLDQFVDGRLIDLISHPKRFNLLVDNTEVTLNAGCDSAAVG